MRIQFQSAVLSLTFLSMLAATLSAAPITGNGPGGVGDPTVTGDLRLWLRGDKGVQTSGGSVTQWNDQSAYGSNFIQSNSLMRPTYSALQNGVPIVSFSNSGSQFLNAPLAGFPIGGAGGATAYVAFRFNLGANGVLDQNGVPFFARSTAYFGLHSNNNNPTNITAYSVGSSSAAAVNGIAGGSFAEGTWGTAQGQFSGAGGLNGVTFTDFQVGHDVGARYLDGQIGEITIYNTSINSAQQLLVQNYFSSKYDTPMGGGLDHYDGDTGGKGNYDYGVFGVINVGGVSVTNSGMDGFGIEATPGLNQGALAGHKVLNNSLSIGNNIGPHQYASMWDRSWYVDSDETFGATIGFNSVDAGLGTLDGSKNYLVLFRDTEVGQWSVLGQGTISGDLVTLNVGNLMSGYYTLAFDVVYLPEPSSMTIFGCGMLCLVTRKRRPKTNAAR